MRDARRVVYGSSRKTVKMLTNESDEEKEDMLDVSMVDGRVRNWNNTVQVKT
jgi:hypothetical protein